MSRKHSKKVKINWSRFLVFLLAVVLIAGGIALADRYILRTERAEQARIEREAREADKAVRKTLRKPLQSESEDVGAAPALEPLLIRCVGDIMAHGPQLTAAKTGSTYEFYSNYKYVEQYFKEADLMLANFETTFSGDGSYSGYPTFDSPEVLATQVKKAGVNVALFANNHMMDSGANGVKNTVKTLRNNGFLAVVGARDNKNDPRSAVIEVNGIKVGITAYTYESPMYNNVRRINGIWMTGDTPDFVNSFRYGDGSINKTDKAAIKAEIQWCKDNGADIVICYFHWGTEYKTSPNSADQALAKYAAQNGADIIFASHPHVLQPISYIKVEVPYKTTEERPAPAAYGELVRPSKAEQSGTWTKTVPVYYSMGNFISNQRFETLNSYYGETTARRTEQGMIANVRILYNRQTGKIIYDNVSCIPTWVDKYSAGGKTYYYVVPLIGDYTKNASLTASNHVTRAKNALTYIKQLVGKEFIYTGD